jgi:hypothetical protein
MNDKTKKPRAQRTVEIKLLRGYVSADGPKKPGAVIRVPNAEAKRLAKLGACVYA